MIFTKSVLKANFDSISVKFIPLKLNQIKIDSFQIPFSKSRLCFLCYFTGDSFVVRVVTVRIIIELVFNPVAQSVSSIFFNNNSNHKNNISKKFFDSENPCSIR